ncbi:hypothetical protein FE257_008229 [Aspergillus nanangensis]|uniref:Cupin type-2 domain-containing protein n=1 Tax=Aspergillus nanangensis TaxID=2582783 RepID=A0AAD4CLR5_ASPNN|nr:hypothetical protein FE257_008229 [Aspergillus nanangensis]
MADSKQQQTLSSGLLPDITYGMPNSARIITTVDNNGKSRFVPQRAPRLYRDRGGYAVTFNYVTDELPLKMQGDIDLNGFLTDDAASPTSYIHTGNRIVNERGMTFTTVNFSPGVHTSMHRTLSVDFVVVVEGQLELELDSGESLRLSPGDVVVQRQTMHRWTNPSQDRPARIITVTSPAQALVINGKELDQEGFSVDGMGSKST